MRRSVSTSPNPRVLTTVGKKLVMEPVATMPNNKTSYASVSRRLVLSLRSSVTRAGRLTKIQVFMSSRASLNPTQRVWSSALTQSS